MAGKGSIRTTVVKGIWYAIRSDCEELVHYLTQL